MKTYRRHKCRETHVGGLDFLLCAFPWFVQFGGHGDYAVLSWCGKTAQLWDTEEEAQEHMDVLTFDGCGPGCRGKHDVVRIDRGPGAGPEPVDPYRAFADEVTL